jgi:hypothetical protein
MQRFVQLVKPSDDVGISKGTSIESSPEFCLVYSKDLEQEINRRIVGKDFKRILVSTLQVHREELNPQQIQQARQMGIESVIDR